MKKFKVTEIHITEEVQGNWHYHLSKVETNAISLCGKKTMASSMSLNNWGLGAGDELHTSYCKKCVEKYIREAKDLQIGR